MRIATLIGARKEGNETDEQFWGNNAYPVPDDFDFEGNGATDITSVFCMFHLFKIEKRYDYLVFRDSCKAHFVPIFEQLTAEEQKLLCKYFIYPQGFDLSVYYNTEEQLINWSVLAAITRPERERRVEACRQKISFYLNPAEATDLLITVILHMQCFEIGQTPHLMLWLTNGSMPSLGIDYTADGFAQKPYYSDELRDLCVDIITNGNYTLYTESSEY